MAGATAEVSFRGFAESLSSEGGLEFRDQFVDGDWRRSGGGGEFVVISPTTEKPVAVVGAASSDDVDTAVSAAQQALTSKQWTSMDLEQRIDILERVCDRLEQEADWIARVQTEQMGAPIRSTRASVTRMVLGNVKSNVKAARSLQTSFLVRDAEGVTLVDRRPVGVIAAIVPWNGPLGFAVDKVSAALLSGCTAVLKAAPETPLEAFALAELFREAGLPSGVFNVVSGGADVGEMLVSHPDVARVTFTGSSPTGKRIAEICARRVARVGLELGGKSPAIVLRDADFAQAAAVIAGSNFGNSGQACHAVTRVLVPYEREPEFVDRVREIAESLVIGDPRQEETQLGPLVSERQRGRVEGYVALARDAGATVAVGGGRPEHLGRGWYVEPTVLVDVSNTMRVAREEIFGPVMSVLRYRDEEEALAIANDSDYGLGGAVFGDPPHALDVARHINTGMCSVNSWGMTRSAPFGGVKDSGLGREHGLWGLESCFEIHAIRLDPSSVDGVGVSEEAAFPGVRP